MEDLYGICLLGMIPMRHEPSHSSEMISQLLFGELFSVTETENDWIKITTTFDSYSGWVSKKSCRIIEAKDHTALTKLATWTVSEPLVKIKHVDSSDIFYIAGGSSIYNFKEEDNTFHILNNWYQFLEKPRLTNVPLSANLPKIAFRYLRTPYLWGGRTAMGIDCSGFSQVVFKIMGISLPRDASMQVNIGETINFLAEAQEGDLAFFDNEEGKIIHVGILLSNSEIIHSSGRVRIDSIDHTGIFNLETRNYSHKLRIIKRII